MCLGGVLYGSWRLLEYPGGVLEVSCMDLGGFLSILEVPWRYLGVGGCLARILELSWRHFGIVNVRAALKQIVSGHNPEFKNRESTDRTELIELTELESAWNGGLLVGLGSIWGRSGVDLGIL